MDTKWQLEAKKVGSTEWNLVELHNPYMPKLSTHNLLWSNHLVRCKYDGQIMFWDRIVGSWLYPNSNQLQMIAWMWEGEECEEYSNLSKTGEDEDSSTN